MKLEKRSIFGSKPFAIFIAENEEESKILDEIFGDKVLSGGKGLIARGIAEVKLADGFREHYVAVKPIHHG